MFWLPEIIVTKRHPNTTIGDYVGFYIRAFTALEPSIKEVINLGHFQVGSYVIGAYTMSIYRSLMEALYTINSPPVVSFK